MGSLVIDSQAIWDAWSNQGFISNFRKKALFQTRSFIFTQNLREDIFNEKNACVGQ